MKNIFDYVGAMELKGKTGEELAEFRVYEKDSLDYFAKVMTPEQKGERRIYLRKVLLKYPAWANLSNEELDEIRVRKINKGYLVENKKGYDYLLPFSGVTVGETEFRRIRAMMPFEFINLTGKDFQWSTYRIDISKSREFVNRYILNYSGFKDKGMGLYIYSSTKGSGKTMLACCLLNEISQRYVGSIKFVNILDLLEMTKKGFDGNDEDIKSIYSSSLLVIDDIGVQMSKEWIDTILYRLINERYVNRLPTIYTSNISVDKLKMDDRIVDRIESTTYPVILPEESIRKFKRQQEKNRLLEEIEKMPH